MIKKHYLVALLLMSMPILGARSDYYESNNSNSAPAKGFLGGTVVGAIIGGATKGAKGAGIGALVGAGVGLVGGLIAKSRKKRDRE